MKLAASRSLLHGTRGRGADSERAADLVPRVRVVVVGRRQGEAVVAHRRPVGRLAGEHVEVADERAAPRAAVGRRRPPGVITSGSANDGVVEGAALEVADHEHAELGAVLDDLGPDAGGAGERGVDVLGVAVDPEQPGVALRAAHHDVQGGPWSVVVTRTLWLVRPPGRSATRQDRPARQARRSRRRSGASVKTQSSKASMTALSIVSLRAREPVLGRHAPPDREHRPAPPA